MVQVIKRFILPALLAGTVAVGHAHAETCNKQNLISAAAVPCLARDVHDADAKMDGLYQSLLKKSPQEAKSRIEASQRAFVKERDELCLLDSGKLGREMWFREMEKSENLMLCEMRYFNPRIAQLEKLLAAIGSASPPGAASQYLTDDALKFHSANEEYFLASRNVHKHGRWYFEVTVNGSALSSLPGQQAIAFQMACGNTVQNKGNGWLAYSSASDNRDSAVFSIALDLDKNRIYVGQNGTWLNGKPGVSGGGETLGGYYYFCGIVSMQRIGELLANNVINVNFGEHAFVFDPPKTFQPFFSRPAWFDAKDSDISVSIDYNSIDLSGAEPTFLTRNDFREQHKTLGGTGYKTIYGQFEVDCSTMTFRQVSLGNAYDRDAEYAFSADMRATPPITAASLGPDSHVGSAAKTMCFLKKNGLPMPQLNTDGKWDSIPSPMPTMHIFEAPDQRVFKNGYMLIKVKNEFTAPMENYGKPGETNIGITAHACEAQTANRILMVRFDSQHHVIGGAFYDEGDALPRLPENRKRYFDGCQSYLDNRKAYERKQSAAPDS